MNRVALQAVQPQVFALAGIVLDWNRNRRGNFAISRQMLDRIRLQPALQVVAGGPMRDKQIADRSKRGKFLKRTDELMGLLLELAGQRFELECPVLAERGTHGL